MIPPYETDLKKTDEGGIGQRSELSLNTSEVEVFRNVLPLVLLDGLLDCKETWEVHRRQIKTNVGVISQEISI